MENINLIEKNLLREVNRIDQVNAARLNAVMGLLDKNIDTMKAIEGRFKNMIIEMKDITRRNEANFNMLN
jgi:hypothetical protein